MQVESKTQWECICTCDGILEKMSKMEIAKNKTCEGGKQDGNHEGTKAKWISQRWKVKQRLWRGKERGRWETKSNQKKTLKNINET